MCRANSDVLNCILGLKVDKPGVSSMIVKGGDLDSNLMDGAVGDHVFGHGGNEQRLRQLIKKRSNCPLHQL